MLEGILLNILDYYLLIGFFGSIIAGEVIIIPLGMISAQGVINPLLAFLSCYLGVLLADSLWFLLGRSHMFGKLIGKMPFVQKRRLPKKLRKIMVGYLPISLTITKFLYGFRIVSILYISRQRKGFLSFFQAAVFANIFGVGTPFLIAWLAGRGLGTYFAMFDNIRIFLTLVIIISIVIYLIKSGISLWLTRKGHITN